MIIRNEKPSDIEAITEVTRLAFEDHPSSQQTEQFIIQDLRAAGALTLSLVGLPTYYDRFGFKNHPQLIHEGIPQEVFVAKPLSGRVPSGTVEFHPAFKQLSIIEKDTVADAIIDYDIAGIKVDFANPAIKSLIEKKILTEMPDGKFLLRPSALTEYDSYFAQVSQFRATEMSRVHKNPFLSAITYGNTR
jgi:predicted N-acetyltransferase YhbS